MYGAVISFNKGTVGKLDVLSALGLKYSGNSKVRLRQINRMLVRIANKKFNVDEKRRGNKQNRKRGRKKRNTNIMELDCSEVLVTHYSVSYTHLANSSN